jgi:uncharacterized membrane protein
MDHTQKRMIGILLALVFMVAMIANFSLAVFIQYSKMLNEAKVANDFTNCFVEFSGNGCATVQTSVYANTFSISNPWYGIIFFGLGAIFFALTLGELLRKRPLIKHATRAKLHKAVMYLLWVGAAFSVWLLYVQYFILHATCKYCLWVDGIMIATALLYTFLRKYLE